MDSEGSNFGKKNEDSILGQPNMKTIVSNLISASRKITDQKLDLDGQQYVAWKRVV